ncbi:MAG TPA: type II toxin-antitoxin system VapC family toxin [Allosphingosinicella sp.]|nr:type II toxin-antitoxin system VapC family toxin [Allosphingosinicella sp.]
MAVLLDSHFVLAILEPKSLVGARWASEPVSVSIASLWEIAIKARQGKLDLVVPPATLEERLSGFGCELLPVTGRHVTAEVDPWPETRDPFDRLLLAVCQVEGLRLVTHDRKLVDHPLAWRSSRA